MSELQRLEKPYKRIMIVGGGNVGAGLALRLEKDYSVKLIERDQQRAAELAEMLHDTIVFMVMHQTKNYLQKNILNRLMYLSPLQMMMKPILCRLCWQNGWVRKSDGTYPTQCLRRFGSGKRY